MNWIVLFINTFFFSGKIAIAPGTMGSMLSLILWFLINPPIEIMLLILLLIIPLSYYTISITLRDTIVEDPQYIVIDEAIGMWIALLFVPIYSIFGICIAFILFRFLDIIKPSIIYRAQFISGSGGILLDDIIAGLIVCLIIVGITII